MSKTSSSNVRNTKEKSQILGNLLVMESITSQILGNLLVMESITS